jgi:hypothetical protein
MTKPGILLFMLIVAAGTLDLKAQFAADNASLPGIDALVPANPQLTHDAILYYRKLTAPLTDLKKANFDYMQSITKMRRARAVERKRQELLKVIQENRDFFKNSGPFQGDSTLKSELIRYLDLVYIVLKQDFDKILDMEDIAAQSYDQAEAHQLALDLAVGKMRASFDVLKKADNDFFKKYRIAIKDEKDELVLKMEKANKAIDYFNDIHRIFYKANKEEFYAKEAIEHKDVAGLEQHAMTLVSFSEEGLKQLKEKKGYEGDDELILDATKLLEFYRNEGLVTCQANVDFNLKSDNVMDAGKKFRSIKEGDRKKEDVDRYNEAVNSYNKAVKEINKINKDSYKTHNKLLKLWNKQTEKFFKKHA